MRSRLGRDWGGRRRGFTLTELLVGMVIVVIVGFIGVPLVMALLGDLQGKGVSGGTRLLSTTLSLARDEALRTAGPYGVRLVRDQGDPWLVDRLRYLQTPSPYTLGLATVAPDIDMDGIVDALPAPNLVDDDSDGFIDELDLVWEVSEAFLVQGSFTTQWLGLIRIGDHFRVNRTGLLYEIIGPDNQPVDGMVDALPANPPGSVLIVAAEPYPNLNGLGGTVLAQGFLTSQVNVPYDILRQPAPAEDQEEVLLPEGVVIDVWRSRNLPIMLQTIMGLDGAPGVAGTDDDGNGIIDFHANGRPDKAELGLFGDDLPPSAWPPIDLLFSPTGQITGAGGQHAIIYVWLAQRGAIGGTTADEVASGRLLTINTRGGHKQANEIDATDFNDPGDINGNGVTAEPDGEPDTPYSLAEQALGTTPQ